MTNKRRKYVPKYAKDYVTQTKLKLVWIIKDRKWTVEALAEATGIPISNFYRWLDINDSSFMPLDVAVVVCNSLEITVAEMLADPMWTQIDENRYLFVRPFMTEPIERVKMLHDFYFSLLRDIEGGQN